MSQPRRSSQLLGGQLLAAGVVCSHFALSERDGIALLHVRWAPGGESFICIPASASSSLAPLLYFPFLFYLFHQRDCFLHIIPFHGQ
jgi:hypothetical protein